MSQLYQLNIQKFVIEMFKVLNNSTPDPQDVATNDNLRQHRKFSNRSVTTVHYGKESIAFLAENIWEIVPENIKYPLWNLQKKNETGFQQIVHVELGEYLFLIYFSIRLKLLFIFIQIIYLFICFLF